MLSLVFCLVIYVYIVNIFHHYYLISTYATKWQFKHYSNNDCDANLSKSRLNVSSFH